MLNKGAKKVPGFTLVELMIVIAVVAILVSLALPNYQQSIRKGRRADAQTDLIEFAGEAERVFTQTNSYANATDLLPDPSDYYTFSFSVDPTATVYTIQAAPKSGQDQDGCGTMRLNQAGLRTKTGSLADCW